MIFTPAQLSAVINAARSWSANISQDESCLIFYGCPPPAFQPAIVLAPFFNGSVEEGRKRFKAFFDIGPVADLTKALPYEEQNALLNPMATHGDRKVMKGASLAQVDEDVLTSLYNEYVKVVAEYPEAKACVTFL